ncbi:MAG: hypothetical protein SOW44_00515 [Porphyromonas sp.]|nr:hypothetical protein [Bacteroidales bacterium]MDY3099816.1 hypothetical protein [Porphyromonas sp.]
MGNKVTKKDLFLELANPDPQTGESRWVYKTEFVGKYAVLVETNGETWSRKDHSALSREYLIEKDRSITPGRGVDAWRLIGYNKDANKRFRQHIRKDIREYFKGKNCVMLGVNGFSINTKIEIDHKDGRKNDPRVSNVKTQEVEDFQPLCKAANDVKRHICNKCKETNIRWDAKNILGNPYSFYEGDENYTENLGCVGCYQYDPVAYRKKCVEKISGEAASFVMKKLYDIEDSENSKKK